MNRLRVAVPAGRFPGDSGTGAGRVWDSVLPRLEQQATVRMTPLPSERGGSWWLWRRPQVWLAPGHEGPVAVHEPVVAVTHGTPWTNEPMLWELVDREYTRQFIAQTEAALRTADFVIVPSDYARRALLDGYPFPEDRVVTVHHGVDTEIFNPTRRGGKARVAEAFGREMPYVLFVSQATPQKNISGLIHAMGRLIRSGYPHALVIAGWVGPAIEKLLRRLADDLPDVASRILSLGRVADDALVELMAEAAAFCLPSFFESFGLSGLEALACGTPVVVSDRGALPEVVGDAAVVTDPTVDGIAAALERVLNDPQLASRLRAAGPIRAQGMSWARTAEGWLTVLRRAAETPAGERR